MQSSVKPRECRGYAARPWDTFALWGAAAVVSPESFVPIRVPPGEYMTWERTDAFTAGDQSKPPKRGP